MTRSGSQPKLTEKGLMNPADATSAAPIRILVAEDDENARTLLCELLSTLGYVIVSEAASGREAISRAKDVIPDVVLLDVHMPDGSGIEAAEQITRTVHGVAVVLFTGDQSLTLSERDLMATAAIALLPKPAPPRALDSTIRLAVARARELSAAKQDAREARIQLANRKTIERAKGILMRRTGSSEQEAYRILQRTSQDRSVPMVDIAKAVLASEPGAAVADGDPPRGAP
ncbi:MAG: response regulator [Gemmatimonadaceae bacterium]